MQSVVEIGWDPLQGIFRKPNARLPGDFGQRQPREERTERIESERSIGDRLEKVGIVRLVQDERSSMGRKVRIGLI